MDSGLKKFFSNISKMTHLKNMNLDFRFLLYSLNIKKLKK